MPSPRCSTTRPTPSSRKSPVLIPTEQITESRGFRSLLTLSLFGWCVLGGSEINRLEDLEVKVLRETIAAAEIEKTIVEVRSTHIQFDQH